MPHMQTYPEPVKFSDMIRPGALLLTDTHFVKQELKVDARQVGLGMYKAVMSAMGKPVVFNICMLGALLGLAPLVKTESIIRVLESRIPAEFLDMNQKALRLGLELAESSPIKP